MEDKIELLSNQLIEESVCGNQSFLGCFLPFFQRIATASSVLEVNANILPPVINVDSIVTQYTSWFYMIVAESVVTGNDRKIYDVF